MFSDDFRLECLEFFRLLVEQRHDHPNANVDHTFRHGEEPEIAGDDGVNKVNFNVADVALASFDPAPVFAITSTIVVAIHHGLFVRFFQHGFRDGATCSQRPR